MVGMILQRKLWEDQMRVRITNKKIAAAAATAIVLYLIPILMGMGK